MGETEYSETSAHRSQTQENYANDRKQHSQQCENLKSRIYIFILVHLFMFMQTRVSNLPHHVFSMACGSQFSAEACVNDMQELYV